MSKYEVGVEVVGINDTGTVIEVMPKSKVVVKWGNGHEQIVSYQSMNNGTARNRSMKIPPKDMPIGSMHASKYGDIEILGYTNNKAVDIRFVKTGSVMVTTVDGIRNDLVKDPRQETIQTGRWVMTVYEIGDIVNTVSCGKCKVIDIVDTKNVTVEFLDTGYVAESGMERLTRGQIKDYLVPSTYGRGFLGDRHVGTNHPKERVIWKDMMKRSYCDLYHERYPTYADVSVCEEWWDFRAFVKWISDNKPVNCSTWQLDKDYLMPGNKVYGPETCTYIPVWLNSSNFYRKAVECSYKNGKYAVSYRGVYMGSYETKTYAQDVHRYAMMRDIGKRVSNEPKLHKQLRSRLRKECKLYCKLVYTANLEGIYQYYKLAISAVDR